MPEIAAKKQADEPEGLRNRFETDLKAAKKFMDPIHQLMDKYYEMYRNRWSDNSQDFQISDLYAYVETVVPILTNNRTRASVKGEFPNVVKAAEGMNYILANTYDVNMWDYKAQQIARMAEIYRSAIAYTGYDTEAKNGTGQLSIKDINIRWSYLDGSVTEYQDSNFFYYIEPTRKSRIFKLYPKKIEDIKESLGRRDSSMGTDQSKNNGWFKSWVRSLKSLVTFNPNVTGMNRLNQYETLDELGEEEKRRGSVAFIHFWYRDEETDEWRLSLWADDVFLEDMENPFWHGKLPYSIYNPTDDLLSSMGVPMAEQIENLNMEKNVLMNLMLDSVKRAVDPPLLYNTAAGIKDPEALREKAKRTNTVGVNNPDFVPLNAIAEFFVQPPLSAAIESMPDRLSTMEDRVTGVNDSFRGMSEATSGKETQLKQEAAYTRIKTKVDNYEKFNRELSEMIIVNAMQFCKDNRAYRVKGDYSKYADRQESDMPFEVKPIQTGTGPDGTPIHDKKEFFLYANPNEWTKIEEESSEPAAAPVPGQPAGAPEQSQLSDQAPAAQPTTGQAAEAPVDQSNSKEKTKKAYRILQMTVDIESGSSLPTSASARKEEAAELFGMGVIDQQALLDAYEYPNADDIMKRMGEAAQAAKQAEQEALQQAEQVKIDGQMQLEKMKLDAQMQMKAVDVQHQSSMNQQNNQAKVEQSQLKQQQSDQPDQQSQTQQPQQPDIAGGLDKIRAAVPELADMPDDVLMKLIAGMGQQPQGGAA